MHDFVEAWSDRSRMVQQAAGRLPWGDVLDLTDAASELELEQALTDRIVDALRELGAGFGFVGRQVHVDVDGDDFHVDVGMRDPVGGRQQALPAAEQIIAALDGAHDGPSIRRPSTSSVARDLRGAR